jgi:hypothetical protein
MYLLIRNPFMKMVFKTSSNFSSKIIKAGLINKAANKADAIPKARENPKSLNIGIVDNPNARNPAIVVVPLPITEFPTSSTTIYNASFEPLSLLSS